MNANIDLRDNYYKDYSSLLQEFVKSYYKQVTLEILRTNLYVDEPKKFFYTLAHKTNCVLEAANVFICNFETKRNLHSPLFILLRSILTDIILSEYIILNSNSDEERSNLIERAYFDHISNTITTVEKTFSQVYNWSQREKDDIVKQLKISKFYDEDGNPRLEPLNTMPNTLIRKIFSNKRDSSNYLLIEAFNLYALFSKFEHFGELSFGLTHQGYDDEQIPKLRFDLYACILIIVKALNNYAHAWEEDLKIDFEYFEGLEQKIENMIPVDVK